MDDRPCQEYGPPLRSEQAFLPPQELLFGLAGWTVSCETIRRRHEAAAQARALRPQLGGVPSQFADAQGQERELHVDAGEVNTPGGFREVEVAVHACRERGEPATSEDYEQRDLPAPAARFVVAEIEGAQQFGQRCQDGARRLGILPGAGCEVPVSAGLNVLGDGAGWIWNLADARSVGASQTPDAYHGVEKLAEAGRGALGHGEQMREWLGGRGRSWWRAATAGCARCRRPRRGTRKGDDGCRRRQRRCWTTSAATETGWDTWRDCGGGGR